MSRSSESIFSHPLIQNHVDLSGFNTLGIQATASVFANITDPGQLPELKDAGFFESCNPLILGGGSNILLKNDPEYPVLKVSLPGIEIKKETNRDVTVTASAGVVWHDLVTWAVQHDFAGIENLALIPGTVGAAPIQNIGAYGIELNQVFVELTAFNLKEGTFTTFDSADCEFGYRDSIFKRDLKGRMVVTDVTLKLIKPPHQIEAGYYALQDYFREQDIVNPAISDVFEAVIIIRKSKLPDPALIGNAGSFFKNPFISMDVLAELQKKYPKMPYYPGKNGLVKIPAGWLIEQAGWKGKQVGNVGTFKNQALVIVNLGGATGREIFDHAKRIQTSVQRKFGIELTPEVNVVG